MNIQNSFFIVKENIDIAVLDKYFEQQYPRLVMRASP